MKATRFIPPVLALAIVVAWNIHQMRSISALERAGEALQSKISAALATGMAGPARSPERKPQTASQATIDWAQVSTKMATARKAGKANNLRELIRTQQQLKKMNREELIASLDELDGLDLTAEDRESLTEMILDSLIKLDPQYALARFVDQIESDSSGVGWQMADAFRQWREKDFKAAAAWFDSQIAAGKFESRSLDGRSEMRTKFEGEMLEGWLASDLDAASRRLLTLPEDQRREVLEELSFSDLNADERKAYASLIRQLIPADERAGSFANIAEQLVSGSDYQQVSAFLDSVQASPEERAVSAKQAAISHLGSLGMDGEITRASVDTLRSWLDMQAPGQSDSIIGKALAEAAQDGGEFDYDAASQLILHYQQSSGRDDVLIAFLQGYSAHSNFEEARALAEMIVDPKQREQILGQFK